LERLHLAGSSVTEDGIRRLEKALPRLKVGPEASP
jgi:hypothetical protein